MTPDPQPLPTRACPQCGCRAGREDSSLPIVACLGCGWRLGARSADEIPNDAICVGSLRSHVPVRRCNGGPNRSGGMQWCGEIATFVVTGRFGLQWFACQLAEHRTGAKTAEPIEHYFARLHCDHPPPHELEAIACSMCGAFKETGGKLVYYPVDGEP